MGGASPISCPAPRVSCCQQHHCQQQGLITTAAPSTATARPRSARILSPAAAPRPTPPPHRPTLRRAVTTSRTWMRRNWPRIQVLTRLAIFVCIYIFKTQYVPRVKEGPLSVLGFYFMYNMWQDDGICIIV